MNTREKFLKQLKEKKEAQRALESEEFARKRAEKAAKDQANEKRYTSI